MITVKLNAEELAVMLLLKSVVVGCAHVNCCFNFFSGMNELCNGITLGLSIMFMFLVLPGHVYLE